MLIQNNTTKILQKYTRIGLSQFSTSIKHDKVGMLVGTVNHGGHAPHVERTD